MQVASTGSTGASSGASSEGAQGAPSTARAASDPAWPSVPASPPDTSREELDARLARLTGAKDAWVKLALTERTRLLREVTKAVLAVAPRWVETVAALKGIRPGENLAGEEWIVGPMATVRNARLLLEALEQGGQPRPPKVTTKKDGQIVARVFPASMRDRALFTGFSAEVWIEPGKPASQGRFYREPKAAGSVALVLGGGNVSSIAPMDVLYKLFVEGEVVLLKMNPVNAALGPHLEEAFAPLVQAGYLAFAYGGVDVGAYLTSHALVDTLHVTGSDRTYDAIVWGADEAERARRKAEGDRKNTRPFSAELGSVTPVLVVPGPWSAADLRFQARQVAAMVTQNASFNCNAAKVLVTARGWLQRAAFLRMVEEELGKTPARKAYYPGALSRYRAFLENYKGARAVGPVRDEAVPWTVIPDVPPREGEYALTHEAFCGVLAEVTLEANHADDFLPQAVSFANERCWGTLSVCVLVHPTTAYEHEEAMDRAISDLRFGGIGVNCWPAVVYALGVTTWGAFPGHTPEDIRSGVGVVHNTYLFDHPQKSIVRAPFRIRPTPAWFADHKNLEELGKRLTELEAAPSFGKLVEVARAAVRG